MLSDRQKQILDILVKAARKGLSPSVRDMADRLGLKSPATVYGHLRPLVEQGLVENVGRGRRYRVVKTPGLPVAGRIQAGTPIESPDGPLGELTLDPGAFSVSGHLVALKVCGNSMVGAGILDGDYVVIRRQPRVENGEIAAVLLDGEGTLKRVRIGKGRVELRPESAGFEPIHLGRKSRVRIYGKLVAVLRGALREQ